MKKYLNVIFCLIFFSSHFNGQTKVIPYQQLPTWSGNPSGSGIFFSATMTSTSLTVTFEGASDRWIALGFGTAMYPGDALIYSLGQSGAFHPIGWFDYHNTFSGTTKDILQDWNIISTNTVSPSQRTVTASRALNTGDANDAVITFSSSVLNLIWAKGATADYTIAYHGSTNRAYNISLPWLSAPVAGFNVTSPSVCVGSTLTFSNTSTGGQTTYNWSFEGGFPTTSTATNPAINYTTPGTYSVSLIATNAVGSNTFAQINYITITPTVSPSLIINTSSNPICSGSQGVFTATPTNGGASPSYQWKVNGINAGSNNPVFSITGSINTLITCLMTSNAACATPSSITSAPLTLTVNSSAPASVSVALSAGTNPMCNGDQAAFTATSGNGGSSPTYQWKINGTNVGSNNPVYNSNTFANGDIITCNLNSNAPCASSTTGISSGITITVSSVLIPAVSIVVAANPICLGTSASFSANPSNGGTSPSFQWKLNGSNVGANSSNFSSSSLMNGDLISCLMTSNSQCANPTSATSSIITITANPVPSAPLISVSGSTNICAGKSLTLTSSAATGNIWSNNSLSQTIIVTSAGIYSLTQTLNGCTSPPSNIITVSVIALPIVTLDSVPDICTEELITLHGNPTGGIYSGIGLLGNVFSVLQSGTVIITYQYTDLNGCTDSSSTNIIVQQCLGMPDLAPNLNSIRVFPNPTSGHNITVSSPNEKIRFIRVSDLTGQQLFYENIEDLYKTSFSITHLSTGIYVVELGLETQTPHMRIHKIE